jgi:aminomethyltransferase
MTASPPPAAPTRLRATPLLARHRALGAKTAGFGGWEMPIEYAGGGVLREHRAVREAVGLFDVSHLGKGVVSGTGAAAHVDACLTNDMGRLRPGQAQYTLACTDEGGVLDDLLAYLRAPEEVLLVPNAANSEEVLRRLAAAAPAGVTVEDLHERLAVLAVQGPRSDALLAAVGLPCPGEYMSFTAARWEGRDVVVCRTGYTGERGVELLPSWEDAGDLWDALRTEAEALGGRACGLGARDTLRTEMGYPLHGQDLSRAVTPLQARTGWAVGWSKPAFWGREALLREREAGPARLLWGVLATERGVPRPHAGVLTPDGDGLGQVTSGTFSPTLGTGIALALLATAARPAEGDEVVVDVRGRPLRSRLVRPPFVAASPRAAVPSGPSGPSG